MPLYDGMSGQFASARSRRQRASVDADEGPATRRVAWLEGTVWRRGFAPDPGGTPPRPGAARSHRSNPAQIRVTLDRQQHAMHHDQAHGEMKTDEPHNLADLAGKLLEEPEERDHNADADSASLRPGQRRWWKSARATGVTRRPRLQAAQDLVRSRVMLPASWQAFASSAGQPGHEVTASPSGSGLRPAAISQHRFRRRQPPAPSSSATG